MDSGARALSRQLVAAAPLQGHASPGGKTFLGLHAALRLQQISWDALARRCDPRVSTPTLFRGLAAPKIREPTDRA